MKGIIQIQRGERAAVVRAFLTLVSLMAGHALLETARDALFLQNLPVEHLPWVYLVIAAIALGISLFDWGDPGRKGLAAWCGLSTCTTLGFYFLMTYPKAWVLYALYIWSGFFISMALVQFWLMTGRLFDLRQAKRVYGFIGAGSVLGALLGYGLAAWLADNVGLRVLLLAAAACFGGATLIASLVSGRVTTGSKVRVRASPLKSVLRVFKEPYLGRLAGLVFVSSVVFTLVDFIFKTEVSNHIQHDQLGAFFGGFYASVTAGSLVVQLLATSALLRWLGVGRTLWILPILLTIGSGLVAVGIGVIAAIALKSSDGVFKHTVHRTAMEVLYIPVADSIRPLAKRLIDMVGHRSAQALGALVILAVLALDGGSQVLAILVVVLGALWTVLVFQLRPHYLELFRTILGSAHQQTQVQLPQLDMNALEALMSALNSPDDNEVLGALNLLASSDRPHLVPALILHHPSKAVVLRALELFTEAERQDFFPITKRLMRHGDPEIRAAAIRANQSPEILSIALKDKESGVVATALVQLLGEGRSLGVDARAQIDHILNAGDLAARRGLARAIGRHGELQPETEALLIRLASDTPSVMSEVAKAMANFPRPTFMHPLIGMLTYREPRSEAQAALLAMGSDLVPELTEALADPNVDFGIRVHLPRTLSLFRDDRVPGLLLDRLLDEESGMIRFKILRALARIQEQDPELPLDAKSIHEAMKRTLRSGYTLLDWLLLLRARTDVHDTPGHELLSTLVEDKLTHCVDRLFRLLHLAHVDEDFAKIYRGLNSDQSDSQASSLELTENLLTAPWKEAVLGLVDPGNQGLSRTERLEAGGQFYTPTSLDYEGLLAHIITARSVTLQAVAAYHIAELGLSVLRPQLETMLVETEGIAEEVVANALNRLDRVGEGP